MFSKLVRIGRDAELKTVGQGTQLCEFSAAYDVGYGQNKQTQWVRCAIFGNRAEKVVGMLTKGKQIVIHASDLKSTAWIKDGEAKSGLECKVQEFEFVSDGQQQQPQQQAPQQYQQAPQQQAPYGSAAGSQSQQQAPQPQHLAHQQSPQQQAQRQYNQQVTQQVQQMQQQPQQNFQQPPGPALEEIPF